MKSKQGRKRKEDQESYKIKDFDLDQPEVVRESLQVKPKYEGKLKMFKAEREETPT